MTEVKPNEIKMYKGIITYFVNRQEFKNLEEQQALIDLFRRTNAELIEDAKKIGYHIMFVTTTSEASRVEKIDYNLPFPAPQMKE